MGNKGRIGKKGMGGSIWSKPIVDMCKIHKQKNILKDQMNCIQIIYWVCLFLTGVSGSLGIVELNK